MVETPKPNMRIHRSASFEFAVVLVHARCSGPVPALLKGLQNLHLWSDIQAAYGANL
jgi:hypothetical protein